VRTRMPGGVGGARASLAPNRFCAGAARNGRSPPRSPEQQCDEHDRSDPESSTPEALQPLPHCGGCRSGRMPRRGAQAQTALSVSAQNSRLATFSEPPATLPDTANRVPPSLALKSGSSREGGPPAEANSIVGETPTSLVLHSPSAFRRIGAIARSRLRVVVLEHRLETPTRRGRTRTSGTSRRTPR
jgi:hypothetical protein